MNFIKGSIEEIRKVIWPTKDQAIKLTIITIIFTVCTTALLALADFGFSKTYNYLLKISPKVQNQQVNLNATNSSHTPTPEVSVGDNLDVGAVDEDGNPVDIETTFVPADAESADTATSDVTE